MSQVIDNIRYSDDLKTVKGVESKEITTAIIKEGVTEIGKDAFQYCENLQSVVIPASVTTIEGRAFYDCPKLTVTFDGTKEEWKKIEGVENCGRKKVKFNK